MAVWNSGTIASRIEHTLLKADAVLGQIEQLCTEARQHHFHGVCVPPYFVPAARKLLNENSLKLVTVAGFPLGYQPMEVKVADAEKAIADGADEIDAVINVSAFKSGELEYVSRELSALSSLCKGKQRTLKIILETAYLSRDEIVQLCQICAEAQVDFVKTSTGFAPQGAEAGIIKLMRETLPQDIRIKASGGIRSRAQTIELLDAGADRIGTSSGIKIISE